MRTFAALFGSFVLCTGIAGYVGCGNDDAPADLADAASSSSSGAPVPPRRDGGGSSSSSGEAGVEEPFCYAEDSPVDVDAYGLPVAQQGVCTDAEVEQAFDLLLTPEPEDPDAGPTQQFVSAHPECATCILGPADWDTDGPYEPPAQDVAPAPAVLLLPGGGTLLDEGACWAAAAGLGADCGQPIVAQTACLNGTCGRCDPDEFTICQSFSVDPAEGPCAAEAAPKACNDQLAAKQAEITAACGTGGAFEPYFLRIAKYLCGGPAPQP